MRLKNNGEIFNGKSCFKKNSILRITFKLECGEQ